MIVEPKAENLREELSEQKTSTIREGGSESRQGLDDMNSSRSCKSLVLF